MTRKLLVPARVRGPGRPATKRTATLSTSGALALPPSIVVEMLGDPEVVRVEADTDKQTIWLTPTTPDDTNGWKIVGGGQTTYSLRLKAFVNDSPEMCGEYAASKGAQAVLLRKV